MNRRELLQAGAALVTAPLLPAIAEPSEVKQLVHVFPGTSELVTTEFVPLYIPSVYPLVDQDGNFVGWRTPEGIRFNLQRRDP